MADLAVRYAEALLMAAKRENALQVIADEIVYLAREFTRSADVFYSPLFPVREQLATVDFVLGDRFHPLTKKFICLLASMRRLGGIGKIADVFITLAHKEMKLIDLYITVFEEVTPEMASEIVKACHKKGLIKQAQPAINLQISQDSNLLGGFIAQCEGIVWDCSLRTRFSDVSRAVLL